MSPGPRSDPPAGGHPDRDRGFGLTFRREPARQLMEGTWADLRPFGWASLATGLLWLCGLGSFLAIAFGLMGIVGRHNVASESYPPPGLRLCQAGTAIGVVGLVATVAWWYTG